MGRASEASMGRGRRHPRGAAPGTPVLLLALLLCCCLHPSAASRGGPQASSGARNQGSEGGPRVTPLRSSSADTQPRAHRLLQEDQVGMVEKFEKELQEAGSTEMAHLKSQIQDLKSEVARLTAAQALSAGSGGEERGGRAKYNLFLLDEGPPKQWPRQQELQLHGPYGFVVYSAYRMAPNRVVVVGFGTTEHRDKRKNGACAWVHGDGRRSRGAYNVTIHVWNFERKYELVLLDCAWPEDDISPHRVEPDGKLSSDGKGYLWMIVDDEVLYPYRETEGYSVVPDDFQGPFKHEVVHCGPPAFGKISATGVKQWMVYHRYVAAFEHFYFYDTGSVDSEMMEVLAPFTAEGLVTITPFRELLQFDLFAQAQCVAMHDCLFRNRNTARWVAYLDYDEYLDAPTPKTVLDILRENKEMAFVSHGCFTYDVARCEDTSEAWDPNGQYLAVERVVTRNKVPFCERDGADPNVCLDGQGHRKFFASPRMVFYMLMHRAVYHSGPGMNMHAQELNHAHYRGLIVPGRPCRPGKNHTALKGVRDWWHPSYEVTEPEKAHTVKRAAEAARRCAATNFQDKEKCKLRSVA